MPCRGIGPCCSLSPGLANHIWPTSIPANLNAAFTAHRYCAKKSLDALLADATVNPEVRWHCTQQGSAAGQSCPPKSCHNAWHALARKRCMPS